MSLFDKIFPKQAVDYGTAGYLKTLTGYQPIFTSFKGGIYEAELCRASIHTFATHCSKLKPVVSGARQDLQKILEFQPNPWMDTTKFLYKTATILETESTCFIVPMYDKYFEKIIGFYPIQPSMAEVREIRGKSFLVFSFVGDNKRASMWLENVGIINKYFYKHEFFGEKNDILQSTLNLMQVQKQGIQEGIKAGATIRFIGKLAQALKPSDIEAERKRWVESNLAIGNQSGIALFDTKYSDVKQVDSKPYIIDATQLEAVKGNVYDYFGTNEAILRNKFTPEEWAAYYEAKIEPFALQLSLTLSNLLFTNEQKVRGNQIQFTSNRLQYASTAEKLAVVQQLTDRGMMSRNEGREVFNLEPVEGGDNYIIRGEYYDANEKINETQDVDTEA